MTAQQLLNQLVEIFPAFAPYWEDPENCFRQDDGSFTVCGVFSEFSSFFREHFVGFSTDVLTQFGDLVTECMSGSSGELDTAAATCFLENVVGEHFSPVLRQYLKNHALEYYEEIDWKI